MRLLITLVALCLPAICEVGVAKADLIINGGFESGPGSIQSTSSSGYGYYWATNSTNNVTVSSVDPASGRYAAMITSSALGNDLVQNVLIPSNGFYTLSFDLLDSGNAATNSDSVRVAIGANDFYPVLPGYPPPAGQYVHYSKNYFESPGAQEVSFVFQGSSDYFLLDNVSLVPTVAAPEPSGWSMLLLGLGVIGGVGAYRRRSKMASPLLA